MGILTQTAGTLIAVLVADKVSQVLKGQSRESPLFRFASPAVAAGKDWVLDFQDSSSKTGKWLPMNICVIANNNTEADIMYYVNQGSVGYTLNAGNTQPIREALRSMRIKNLSSSKALAAGDIEILTKRVA